MLTSYIYFMDYLCTDIIMRSVAAQACRTRSLVYKASNVSQIQRERGVVSLCDLILHPQNFRLYWNIIVGVGVRKGGNGWGVIILGGSYVEERNENAHTHTHTPSSVELSTTNTASFFPPHSLSHTHHNNINLSPISSLSLSLSCSP